LFWLNITTLVPVDNLAICNVSAVQIVILLVWSSQVKFLYEAPDAYKPAQPWAIDCCNVSSIHGMIILQFYSNYCHCHANIELMLYNNLGFYASDNFGCTFSNYKESWHKLYDGCVWTVSIAVGVDC
jgi:hypothetical protein